MSRLTNRGLEVGDMAVIKETSFTLLISMNLLAVSFLLLGSNSYAQVQQQQTQENLTKIIEGKFFNAQYPSVPDEDVIYESPKTVILDASEFHTNDLWQAVDIAKDH